MIKNSSAGLGMAYPFNKEILMKEDQNLSIVIYKNNGLTIIELMIVISLIAMLMAIGVVSYKTLGVTNKLNTATNDIYYDFVFARTKAMEGQSCVTISFNKTIKINGIDTNIDYLITESKICDVNDISKILKMKKLDKNISLLQSISQITFDHQGFINGVSNTTLTVKIKASNKTLARDITINKFGRIRLGSIYESN